MYILKFQIKHEIKGRMRLHIFQKKQMSCEQADILLYYLENIEGVESAKVYERTADAVSVMLQIKMVSYDRILLKKCRSSFTIR